MPGGGDRDRDRGLAGWAPGMPLRLGGVSGSEGRNLVLRVMHTVVKDVMGYVCEVYNAEFVYARGRGLCGRSSPVPARREGAAP